MAAAAVLRPTGSARMCDAGTPRSSRATAAMQVDVGDDPKISRSTERAARGDRRWRAAWSQSRRCSEAAWACAFGCAARSACRARRQAGRRSREGWRMLRQMERVISMRALSRPRPPASRTAQQVCGSWPPPHQPARSASLRRLTRGKFSRLLRLFLCHGWAGVAAGWGAWLHGGGAWDCVFSALWRRR